MNVQMCTTISRINVSYCPALPCPSITALPRAACSSRSTDAAAPHTHRSSAASQVSRRGGGVAELGMQTKSKMRVHILHDIPQQQQHHVGSCALSPSFATHTHSYRERVSCISSCSGIYRLRLLPQFIAACTVHILQFSQLSAYTLTPPPHPFVAPFWHLQCFIVAGIFGSFCIARRYLG